MESMLEKVKDMLGSLDKDTDMTEDLISWQPTTNTDVTFRVRLTTLSKPLRIVLVLTQFGCCRCVDTDCFSWYTNRISIPKFTFCMHMR